MDEFNLSEQQRYARHFMLHEIGAMGQFKLKQARVLCIGAGGLGSAALLYLAAAGVGTIGIVDHDVIELSNLQRQVLYSTTEIGNSKVQLAKAKLLALNPEIVINAYQVCLSPENAPAIIREYDLVIDCTDNYTARYLINDVCCVLHKPYVYGSVLQFQGFCTVFNANSGPCYRCLFRLPPPANLIPKSHEIGLFGVVPGVIGTIQATEAIKLITNVGDPLIGRLLVFNALTMQFDEMVVKKNPACNACSEKHDL